MQQQGFGMNGGFGIAGGGNQTEIIACVRYNLVQNEQTKQYTVKIVDFVEMKHLVVENILKYFATYFGGLGFMVEFELDLSKLTRNVIETVQKYFATMVTYTDPTYSALCTYINVAAQDRRRIHPAALNLKSFLALHPEYEKDTKFPKSLTDYESKAKFEEFKSKAGYIQVLHPGVVKFHFNPQAIPYVRQEMSARAAAISQNKTLEEFMEDMKAGRTQQAAPQQQGFGGGFGGGFGMQQQGFGMNGGFGMNPGFGGMQQGFGGGFQQGGFMGQQQGFGMQQGGFGMNPGFGMQQPYGMSAYPMQQGNASGGKKGKGGVHPQTGMAPGYPQQPMMNPAYGMNMGMGMGYPMNAGYVPGSVAGGAFPGPMQMPGGGAAYIPG